VPLPYTALPDRKGNGQTQSGGGQRRGRKAADHCVTGLRRDEEDVEGPNKSRGAWSWDKGRNLIKVGCPSTASARGGKGKTGDKGFWGRGMDLNGWGRGQSKHTSGKVQIMFRVTWGAGANSPWKFGRIALKRKKLPVLNFNGEKGELRDRKKSGKNSTATPADFLRLNRGRTVTKESEVHRGSVRIERCDTRTWAGGRNKKPPVGRG